MLHPVGSQPPAVYWRRRLLVLASLVLLLTLLILTVRTALSDGGQSAAASGRTDPAHTTTSPAGHGTAAGQGNVVADQTRSGQTAAAAATGAASSPKPGAATSKAPAPCTAGQLAVKAVVGKPQYAVGDQPVLTLQVTNNGPAACVQNVADSQIVLTVYNGASRVWGSHDCQIQPGVAARTLDVGKAAGFSIVWSGLTSQPKCAGTRQRVGAGTYTLYPTLSGHRGTAQQFTIS